MAAVNSVGNRSRGGASYVMIKRIIKAITLRDVLIIIGLSLIGVGLYLFLPWVSLTVCGALILVGGFFMQEKK